MSGTTEYRCAFCGTGKSEDRQLIAGPPRVFICSGCVSFATVELARSSDHSSAVDRSVRVDDRAVCGFCGRSPGQDDAFTLVRGKRQSICSDCLNICDEILVGRAVGEWSGRTVVLRVGLPQNAVESKVSEITTELRKSGSCRVVVLLSDPAELPSARRMLSTLVKDLPQGSFVSDLPVAGPSTLVAVAAMIAAPKR
jgi:hypothetical protein